VSPSALSLGTNCEIAPKEPLDNTSQLGYSDSKINQLKGGFEMAEKEVGKVTHYFAKIHVAGIELSDELTVGDTILIKGATTYFQQKVESMQLENQNIDKGEPGQLIGVTVQEKARPGDKVYKME
jgi:translation elongation factor EF-1alpha